MTAKIIAADCRTDLALHGPFDVLFADPPYGDTSLAWDRRVDGWIAAAKSMLKPTGSMWVFGSLRSLMASGPDFKAAGWRYAQDIVWEKHNGSGLHNDRFKRVHEHVVQFISAATPWNEVFNEPQREICTSIKPRVRRVRSRPPHFGGALRDRVRVAAAPDGMRFMRSVIFMRSTHGRAIHPTEKPDSLLEILIRTSCPLSGLVGDMFAGSGAAGEAALRAGRRYVGCEIDSAMAERAKNRLAALLPLSSEVA